MKTNSIGDYVEVASKLRDLYEEKRPSEYPNFNQILGLYKKITKERLSLYRVGPEEAAELLWKSLEYCLRKFRPEIGYQGIPVERRFRTFFCRKYKWLLAEQARPKRKKRPRPILLPYEALVRFPQRPTSDAGEFWEEARGLFDGAIARLDPPTRKFINLRYIQGMKLDQIAKEMKKCRRTIQRQFQEFLTAEGVARLISININALILEKDRGEVFRWIRYLLDDAGLTAGEVARLFAMSREDFDELNKEMNYERVNELIGLAGRKAG